MIGDDKIKDLFASKLGESFEPEVPAGIWAGIDQLLSQLPIPAPDPTTSSATSGSSGASAGGGASVGVKIGIGLAISALVGSAIVYVNIKNTEQPGQNEKIEIPVTPAEKIVSDTTLVLDSTLFENSVETIHHKISESALNEDSLTILPIIVDSLQESFIPSIGLNMEDSISADREDTPINVSKNKKYYIAALGSYDAIGLNVIQNKANGMLVSQPHRSESFMTMLDKEGAKYLLSHQQPISFGILIGKNLNSKWSIESGIFYTHLSSLLTSASGFEIRETQKFDYIGIPFYLKYNLLKLGKVEFDTKLGGMIQKDVQGKLISTIGNLNYSVAATSLNEPYYMKKYINQNNPQLSLHGALGVTYPLYRDFCIFGTIGGVYYFDANNNYRTIYVDQKFQLNTTLGLKFNF